MSDQYILTVDGLAADRATRIAHIPRDIVGIIRGMYPRTYTHEFVADVLSKLRKFMEKTGDLELLESAIPLLMEPNLMDICRIHEKSAESPISWWCQQYFQSGDHASVREQCIRIHGSSMWDQVREYHKYYYGCDIE